MNTWNRAIHATLKQVENLQEKGEQNPIAGSLNTKLQWYCI